MGGLGDACSNFAMENTYGISVRTMDLGTFPFQWTLVTKPTGSKGFRSSRHGFVAVVGKLGPVIPQMKANIVAAGMNDAGLSCDIQTLLGSTYPARNATVD